ncbi:MAG: hypothetical protein WCJ36_00460 [Candidatus Saccharibacteria bacterium]
MNIKNQYTVIKTPRPVISGVGIMPAKYDSPIITINDIAKRARSSFDALNFFLDLFLK